MHPPAIGGALTALAAQVVMQAITLRFLRPAREFKTLNQMFRELNKHQPPRRAGQQPLLLFLGGGMAAGAVQGWGRGEGMG